MQAASAKRHFAATCFFHLSNAEREVANDSPDSNYTHVAKPKLPKVRGLTANLCRVPAGHLNPPWGRRTLETGLHQNWGRSSTLRAVNELGSTEDDGRPPDQPCRRAHSACLVADRPHRDSGPGRGRAPAARADAPRHRVALRDPCPATAEPRPAGPLARPTRSHRHAVLASSSPPRGDSPSVAPWPAGGARTNWRSDERVELRWRRGRRPRVRQ
jgi:hypothetical protein